MALVRTSDLMYEDTIDPTASENFAAGFKVGDDFRNTATNKVFMCTGDGLWSDITASFAKWFPTAITLGDAVTNGVSAFNAIGAGHLFTFDPAQDDELLWNIGLDRNGKTYDGSSIGLELHWMLFSAPAVGNTVIWELDYAFASDDDDNYTTLDGTVSLTIDAGARIQRQQYSDQLPIISGSVGATTLQITLRRNGAGVGADTYGGDVDLYGIHLNV